MCKNIDFGSMTWDDLETLEKAVSCEKMHRKQKRFNELAIAAAKALTALKNEYPYVELTFGTNCEDCGYSTEINLFDYFNRFDLGNFSME